MADPLLKLGNDLSQKIILEQREKNEKLKKIKIRATELDEKIGAHVSLKKYTN